MEKLIITVAICGAEVTKKHNPAVPYTVEEMVREVKGALEAGTAVIHVHIREDDGTPTQDRERPRVVLGAIKKACLGVILVPSIDGAVGMTAEERLQSIELFPEMATPDCGTCNFGDNVSTNDMPTMRASDRRMVENHIKSEYECFEIGHLDTVVDMASKGRVSGVPTQFNFVLGVSGYTPATVDNLDYLIKQISTGSTWTVTGVDRGAWSMVAVGIVMGGNVRVGFEDDIYLEKGHRVASDGKPVEKVVRLAKELGHETTTPDEARRVLSLA